MFFLVYFFLFCTFKFLFFPCIFFSRTSTSVIHGNDFKHWKWNIALYFFGEPKFWNPKWNWIQTLFALHLKFNEQWSLNLLSISHNVSFFSAFIQTHKHTNTHANSRTFILHGHPQKLSSYYLLFAAFSISVFGCYFLVSKFWIICQPQNGNEFFFTVGMRKMGGLSIK